MPKRNSLIMKLHGFLEAQDLIRAYFLHIKPRPLITLIGSILLMMCIWVIIRTWPFQSWQASILTLILLYFLVYFFLYMPYKCHSVTRNKKILQEPFSWNFTDEKISLSASGVSSELDWEHFNAWKENKQIILIYNEFRDYTMIPKRWFVTQKEETEFIRLLQKNLAAER